MKSNIVGRHASRLLAGVCLASIASSFALAQAPAAGDDEGQTQVDAVVVTGTLVRGVAPIGSAVQSVGTADIQRQGVTQSNQLLATIPQMAGFSAVPRTSSAASGVTNYRPNLRNLPPLQNGTTLIMLDSHNLVGGGLLQNFGDISALPTGAIERVEVVLDGGSATYGSDAVGGVLNFITRSHFKGVQVTANAGFVPDTTYRTYNFEVTAGHDWDGGGAVIVASTRQNSSEYAEDRDFPRQNLTPFGGSDFRVRNCAPGNVIIGAQTYALPGRVPGSLNLCDSSIDGAITGAERQNSAFVSVSQRFADNLDFQLKGYVTDRLTRNPAAQFAEAGAVIPSTNPYFQRIGTETQQTVAFNWSPVAGRRSISSVKLRQYDITPSLTWHIGRDWELKALGDYGRSYFTQHIPAISTTAETAALRSTSTATALNPYNLPATNPAVIAGIIDFENYFHSVQNLRTARVIADGPVFDLPAGPLRLAVGGQMQHASADNFTVSGRLHDKSAGSPVEAAKTRNVNAVFGELVIPVISSDMGVPLVRDLSFDISARYNKYQRIGSTTDPKFAVSWTVVDGLKLRANWGTAFVAPGLNETNPGDVNAQVQVAATTATLRTGSPATDRNRPNITIQGGNANLQPVTARTWSAGFGYTPPQVSGLTVSGSYWNVEMDNLISVGCPGNFQTILNDPSLDGVCYYSNPTLAQAQALTAPYKIYVGSTQNIPSLYGAGNDPVYLRDGTKKNFGGYNTSGIDFRVAYRYRTDWGALYGTVSGTKYLTRESQTAPGQPFTDLLVTDFSKYSVQGVVGVDIGSKFTATATMNYTSGYTLTGVPGQTHISSYAPINLFFRYNVRDNTTVTLNIDNVRDDYPPFINQSGGITGSTLGRYISVGLRQAF